MSKMYSYTLGMEITMTKICEKVFGGLDLTWKKIIIAAIIAGIYTALMAMIPLVRYTSFNTISVTMELWILAGIIIIMNAKSNMDSALKCFVFFLISQPIVYLIQVPFNPLGWGIFGYYRTWFVWTVLCLPMGYIGYYMKKDQWWGYLILLPMIALTARSYYRYLGDFLFYMPRYSLICIFCIGAMILYPIMIFRNKKIHIVGGIVGILCTIAVSFLILRNPPAYSTEILSSDEDHIFDETYTVALEDSKYGNVDIRYMASVEVYMVHADFAHGGDTVLTLTSPEGETMSFDVHIERDTYEVTPRQ